MPIYRIQTRRDTDANWTGGSAQTLAQGEMGLRTTNDSDAAVLGGTTLTVPVIKIGDGSTAWTSLPYAFAPGTCATNGDATTNYASKADPIFTGTAKAPDVTVEAAASAAPTLTVNATDAGSSVLTHDTLTTANVGTSTTLVTASHITNLTMGKSGTSGSITFAHTGSTANLTNATTTVATSSQSGDAAEHTEAANARFVRTNSMKAVVLGTGTGAPSGSDFPNPRAGDMFFRAV